MEYRNKTLKLQEIQNCQESTRTVRGGLGEKIVLVNNLFPQEIQEESRKDLDPRPSHLSTSFRSSGILDRFTVERAKQKIVAKKNLSFS